MVALFWRLVSRFPASGTTDVGSPALLAACGRVAHPLTSSTIFFNGCPVLRVLCEGRARCRWYQEIFVCGIKETRKKQMVGERGFEPPIVRGTRPSQRAQRTGHPLCWSCPQDQKHGPPAVED